MEIRRSLRLRRYASAIWLPVLLCLVFVLQNLIFNVWFGITPGQYYFRLGAVSFALGAALYGPAIIFNQRAKFAYLLAVSLIISFVFIAQFEYYSYSGAFLQATAIKYVGLAVTVGGTIKTLLSIRLLIFCLNTIAVLAAAIVAARQNLSQNFLAQKERLAIMAVIAVIAYSGYGLVFNLERHEWGNTSRLYSDLYDLNTLVGKMGIINFSLEDTIKYVIRSNAVKAADINFVKAWSSEEAKAATTPHKYFGVAAGRNVIYIQIESMENAVINKTISGQEITPNLNALAKSGLYFNNYYSEVGPGNTADAEFVTMNSLYALPDDVAFIDYAQNDYSAWPQLLSDNGYHTYAFHGDVATFWNRSSIYPKLGYQQWFSRPDFSISRNIGSFDLGDEDFFSQSISKLKSLPQPFLATMITLSSHTPFVLPADLNTLDLSTAGNLSQVQANYLQSVHYTDRAIGEFIEQLKQNGLYDNSIIVIYGDHQSYTNIAQAVGPSPTAWSNLADNQVPLIILAPNSKLKSAIISAPSSHLDLYPTAANLLGLMPPSSVLGQDILNAATPTFTHRNSDTGTINTILTPNLAYEASTDGIFEHGSCLNLPAKQPVPAFSCQHLFDQESAIIKTSDLTVRGNLLHLLLDR